MKKEAQRLVDRFWKIDDDDLDAPDNTMTYMYAKQCAIICCEEIKKSYFVETSNEYWDNLIKEIKKV